jgi:hypothetical protein
MGCIWTRSLRCPQSAAEIKGQAGTRRRRKAWWAIGSETVVLSDLQRRPGLRGLATPQQLFSRVSRTGPREVWIAASAGLSI